MLDTTVINHKSNELENIEIQQEIQTIYFEQEQADLLHNLSDEIAHLNGVEGGGKVRRPLYYR